MTVKRSDLEDKLREIQGAIDETAEGAKSAGVAAAIAVVLVLAIVYLLGRRKGKKNRPTIKIYRG